MSSEPEGKKTAAAAPKVVFKKVKSKNHCRRRNDDSDDGDSGNGDESLLAKLEESKELRKYRRRQGGVSAEGLLVGETTAKKEGADVISWGAPPTLEAPNFLQHDFAEHGSLREQNSCV